MSGDASLESLPMRQLRLECKTRGIDITGCLEKSDIISRLRAATVSLPQAVSPGRVSPIRGSDGTRAGQGAPVATAEALPVRGSHASDSIHSNQIGVADNWDNMTMRELRRQGSFLGVDFSSCHDKFEVIRRLRAAVAVSTPGTDDQDPDQKLGAAAAPQPSSNGVDDKDWEAMPMRDLRKECKLRGIDCSGFMEKADVICQLRSAAGGGTLKAVDQSGCVDGRTDEAGVPASFVFKKSNSCDTEVQTTGIDAEFAMTGRVGASLVKQAPAHDASADVQGPKPRRVTSSVGADVRVGDSEPLCSGAESKAWHDPGEATNSCRVTEVPSTIGNGGRAAVPCASEAQLGAEKRQCGASSTTEAELGTSKPFEGMSTRQLRRACESLRIDISGCYAKSEVISRLQAHVASSRSERFLDAGTEAMKHYIAGTSFGGDLCSAAPQLNIDGSDTSEVPHQSGANEVSLPFQFSAGTCDPTPWGRASSTRAEGCVHDSQPPQAGAGSSARQDSGEAARGSGVMEVPPSTEVATPAAAPCTSDAQLGAEERQHGASCTTEAEHTPCRPFEAMSMCQLREACESLGIDISRCFAKSEVISRLQAHGASDGSEKFRAAGAEALEQSVAGTSSGGGHGSKTSQRNSDALDTTCGLPHEAGASGVPLGQAKPTLGVDTGVEKKSWEAMSMRQLRRECEDRGIDLTGCYAKCEVIRRLRAWGSSRVSAAEQERGIANPNEAAAQDIVGSFSTTSQKEVRGAMSTQELRPECRPEDVDMASCHDRARVSGQLQAGPIVTGYSLIDLAPNRPLQAGLPGANTGTMQEAADGSVTGVAGHPACEAQAGSRPLRVCPLSARSGDPETAIPGNSDLVLEISLHSGRRLALSTASLEALSAWELRQECDIRSLDLDGCLDKTDIVHRLMEAMCSAQAASTSGASDGEPPGVRGRLLQQEASAVGEVLRRASPPPKHSQSAATAQDAERLQVPLQQRQSGAVLDSAPSAPEQQQRGAAPTRARERVSIADLYKLSNAELCQKCASEGIPAEPNEPKGALIVRLRQARSKTSRCAMPDAAAAGAPPSETTAPMPDTPAADKLGAVQVEAGKMSLGMTRKPSRSPGVATSRVEPMLHPDKVQTSTSAAAEVPAPDVVGDAGHGSAAVPSTTSGGFFDFDDLPDDLVGPSSEQEATEAQAPSGDAKQASLHDLQALSDMTMADLRQECQRHSVDLTGCFDKAACIRRLQEATILGTAELPGVKAKMEPIDLAEVPAKAATHEQLEEVDPRLEAARSASLPSCIPTYTSVKSPSSAAADASPAGLSTSEVRRPHGGNGLPAASGEAAKDGWSAHSVKELLEMAMEKGIDVSNCVEKQDIVERLRHGPTKAQAPTKARRVATAKRAKSAAAPQTSRAAPETPGRRASRVQAAPAAPAAPRAPRQSGSASQDGFPGWKTAAASKPPSPASAGAVQTSLAPERAAAPAQAARAETPLDGWSPSSSLSWSSRVRRFFECYPGFSAALPPEAEMWSDRQLEVYFGSNGEIWPTGKRPSWIGRPSEEKPPDPQVPKKKQYPDLKEHFETLDLAETTPHDMIRRHYRRLARDCHPDKHPDDIEAATERFRKITTAYEAIRDRLHL